MTDRSHRLAGVICFTGLLLLASNLVLAGPNEGGTLILHANPSLVFTDDIQNYCGMSALDSCSAAVTSVAWESEKRIVFHVLAAFPPGSSPRLKGLAFGIDFDSTKFILAARGKCADFEIPGARWPAPGTGTTESWTTGTQTNLLVEAYWFVGYAYSGQTSDSTSVALIPHPLQHGLFVDDSSPAAVDTIAAYGTLGFGMSGHSACAGTPGGDSADGGETPGSPGGSDPDGSGPESPDNPPDVGSPGSDHVPPVDPRCVFPRVMPIPEGSYLIVLSGADSVAYTNTQVEFTMDASDTLRVNGYPVVPARPKPPSPPSEQQCERLAGSVPFAQALVQHGHSWCEAYGAYRIRQDSLVSVARSSYRAMVDRGANIEVATSGALEVFRGSSLVSDETATARLGHPSIHVTYAGFPVGVTYLLEGMPARPSSRHSEVQCDYYLTCDVHFVKHPGPVIVVLRYGSIIVIGGAGVDRYLTGGGM